MRFLQVGREFINYKNIESIFIKKSDISFNGEEQPSGEYTLFVRTVSGQREEIYSGSKQECNLKMDDILKELGGNVWDIARS